MSRTGKKPIAPVSGVTVAINDRTVAVKVLPEHVAPVPVIIQAAAGAGTVILGDQRVHLDGTHPVSLAPNVPHAVEPEAGTDVTLVVFHVRGRAAP